jgi:glycogen debranching enzyme
MQLQTLLSEKAVEQSEQPHRGLPSYFLSDHDLAMGPSLGNSALWVTTKNNGVIERVFSTACGESMFGVIGVRFALSGHRNAAKDHDDKEAFIVLRSDGLVRQMELHPVYIRSRYSIGGAIQVVETTFVPLTRLEREEDQDPPFVYKYFEITNAGYRPHFLRITAFARFSGAMSSDVRARFEESAGALVVRNRLQPRMLRVIGMSEPSLRYQTTCDFGEAYDPQQAMLTNSTDDAGDVIGALQFDLVLSVDQTHNFGLKAGVFPNQQESVALERYRSMPSAEQILNATLTYASESLHRTEVLTPDAVINQGALWSKVNMRRVIAKYPYGFSFTNDPGTYSNIVLRDVAWFVHGCDYHMPLISRAMLETFAQLQYRNGKLPEFYNGITGQAEDFGLNINDDTPLFIVAVAHHFRATNDFEWLRSVYPHVGRAARYIIEQIDERGLVFCSAKDPRGNLWAIASWRNIIPNYTINGAVTEINAECSAALRQAALLARALDDPSNEADEFERKSETIRTAMDAHLINPKNGLYYLNVDADGNPQTDVTGDQVFPVIFGVCDQSTSQRIVARLTASDFWTRAGLRTASWADPRYDPAAYSGLIGGVWPGLTWWFAFAAARAHHSDFMVRALRSSFEHYAENPRANNTVPGQFSEWFDGESLANRGMRLSPWEPPRFLWAAVEGVCGLNLKAGTPRINPLVPLSWNWVGVRRLHYHSGELSYFAVRMEGRFDLYSTAPVETEGKSFIYDSDVTDAIGIFTSDVVSIALRSDDGSLVVLLGPTGSTTANVALDMRDVLESERMYVYREYRSENEAWTAAEGRSGYALRSLAASIEASTYRIVSIVPA